MCARVCVLSLQHRHDKGQWVKIIRIFYSLISTEIRFLFANSSLSSYSQVWYSKWYEVIHMVWRQSELYF